MYHHYNYVTASEKVSEPSIQLLHVACTHILSSTLSCSFVVCSWLYQCVHLCMHAVVEKPPYEVSASGYGGFKLPIRVYFSNKETVTFTYGLRLHNSQVSTVLSEMYTFRNPNKDFREKLLLAGGIPCQCQVANQERRSKKRPATEYRSKQPASKKRQIQPSTSKGRKREDTSDSSSDEEWTLSQNVCESDSSDD